MWKSVLFDYPIRIRLNVRTVALYKHIKLNKSDTKYFTIWTRSGHKITRFELTRFKKNTN